MSKLEKREQKNLEAAFFRLKEENEELQEAVKQQAFLLLSTKLNGYIQALADLCIENWGEWESPQFGFSKIKRHKCISDITKNTEFKQQVKQNPERFEIHLRTWIRTKISETMPLFIVCIGTNNYEEMRKQKEVLEYIADTIYFDVVQALRIYAHQTDLTLLDWEMFEDTNYPKILVFQLANADKPIQYALHFLRLRENPPDYLYS